MYREISVLGAVREGKGIGGIAVPIIPPCLHEHVTLCFALLDDSLGLAVAVGHIALFIFVHEILVSDPDEAEEREIIAGLRMIKAYLKRSTEVSTGIKTTLKVLIAIVSLASAISSILRFVCYL